MFFLGEKHTMKLFKITSSILAALIVVALLPSNALAASFPDVDENSEYAEAIDTVSDLGYMIGDENGNFNPYRTVTRAEMATIICRMLGEDKNLSNNGTLFADVPKGHWANGYITKANSLGIVLGYGNGYYGPTDNITYEQAVTMIVRVAGNEERDFGGWFSKRIFKSSTRGRASYRYFC